MFHKFTFDELPSTNDYLKQEYRGYPTNSVIVANKQTKGRGRFDRVWESDQDLTFSLLFHASYKQSFLAPLAVVLALKGFHITAGIKWPNDILVENQKICGILIEKLYDGATMCAEIVGIGINLSWKPKELNAAYVALDKKLLLDKILEVYEQLLQESNESLLQYYQSYNLLKGKKITHKQKEYIVLDVQEDGYLVVQHDQEIVLWKSEEISLHHIQW